MAHHKILPRFYHPHPWVQLLCFKFVHPSDVPQVSQTWCVLSNLGQPPTPNPPHYCLSNSDIYHCVLGPGNHPGFFPHSSRVKHQSLSSSVQFNRSVVSNSLRPHESQHTRPPCPSPTPRVHPNSCPLSQWCHPDISSSVVPFSSCPQSLPEAGSFPMSQLFA